MPWVQPIQWVPSKLTSKKLRAIQPRICLFSLLKNKASIPRILQDLPQQAFSVQNMGSVGVQRSLVAHLLWEQGVQGSNPCTPTTFSIVLHTDPAYSAHSSAGQSNALLRRRSHVRIVLGRPKARLADRISSKNPILQSSVDPILTKLAHLMERPGRAQVYSGGRPRRIR